MRGKPDIRSAQNVEQFLRGGQAAAAETPPSPDSAPAGEALRITKTIRMDRATDLALKRAALEGTIANGARVTESDLIEQAIKLYLKL